MERLTNTKPTGITANALRTWGMLFLMAGIAGRGILQTHMLGFYGLNSQQLLAAMQASENAMTLTSVSLVLQALEVCAVPIFAMLLVEGVTHTSNFKAYFIRVLGTAALSEIPYNLVMSGKLFDFSTRNPVFSVVLSMVVLFFFRRFAAPGFRNVLIKILITFAGLVWARMLGIDFGGPMLLLVAVLWALRNKGLYRSFIGASVAIACSLFSPFFLISPMAFLAIHMCNGEKGEENRMVNYLAYPAVLAAMALIGILCF
jgi:hypothetical protein